MRTNAGQLIRICCGWVNLVASEILDTQRSRPIGFEIVNNVRLIALCYFCEPVIRVNGLLMCFSHGEHTFSDLPFMDHCDPL